MKILQILVVMILVGGFSHFANAQACGDYSINIKVQNESSKPIDNALIQFLPITKDQTQGNKFERNNNEPSNFTLTFFEGQQLTEFHRLIVSADGYKTAENELKTVSCENKIIVVKLAKTDSSSDSVWNFQNKIKIQATDENGENLESPRIIVTDGEKIVTQLRMQKGYINFMLKNGIYNFQIKEKAFQIENIKVDSAKITGQSLNIKLKKLPTAVLTGTVKLDKKNIEGAVIRIRDEGYNEYFAKTDDKGKYRINLPFGKYFIYSTVNDKCWMCAEFYRKDFFIDKEGEINLDIELMFMGEG